PRSAGAAWAGAPADGLVVRERATVYHQNRGQVGVIEDGTPGAETDGIEARALAAAAAVSPDCLVADERTTFDGEDTIVMDGAAFAAADGKVEAARADDA